MPQAADPDAQRGCHRLARTATWRGSRALSTARPVPPRPEARVGTRRSPRSCPRRPPARTREGLQHPPPRLLTPVATSPPRLRLPATLRSQEPAPRVCAAMFLFFARQRHGHLTSGLAAAKAVPGLGCVEGVIKGEGVGEEGRRAGPRLRRLKRDSPNGWGGRERRPRREALGPGRAAERGAAAEVKGRRAAEAPSKGPVAGELRPPRSRARREGARARCSRGRVR